MRDDKDVDFEEEWNAGQCVLDGNVYLMEHSVCGTGREITNEKESKAIEEQRMNDNYISSDCKKREIQSNCKLREQSQSVDFISLCHDRRDV